MITNGVVQFYGRGPGTDRLLVSDRKEDDIRTVDLVSVESLVNDLIV